MAVDKVRTNRAAERVSSSDFTDCGEMFLAHKQQSDGSVYSVVRFNQIRFASPKFGKSSRLVNGIRRTIAKKMILAINHVEILRHPSSAGNGSARCALLSTHTLTGLFLLKYSSSPLPGTSPKRCIMNNFNQNSAQILASRKECYAQKN
jgi:hypothetical protein